MSRKTIYHDSRLTLVSGEDHLLGSFLQLFDKKLEDKTAEGEGLIYEWSQRFGTETNFTGIGYDTDQKPMEICQEYIDKNKV